MKTEILMEMGKKAKGGGGEERQIVKFEEQKGEKNEQRSGKEMRADSHCKNIHRKGVVFNNLSAVYNTRCSVYCYCPCLPPPSPPY